MPKSFSPGKPLATRTDRYFTFDIQGRPLRPSELFGKQKASPKNPSRPLDHRYLGHDALGNLLHPSDQVGTRKAGRRNLSTDTTPKVSPRTEATRRIGAVLGAMNFFDYKTVQTRITRGQITRVRNELAALQKIIDAHIG